MGLNRRHTRVLRTALIGGFCVACMAHPGLAQETDVQGVWARAEHRVVTDQGTRVDRELQPGLYIFTAQFFSVTYIDGEQPRPPRGPRSKSQLTPAEKVAEYDPFVSYSGTYEVRGQRIIFSPRVSLNPSFMTGGARIDEFEIDGDVMWLIMRPRPGATTPIQEIRTKLVRLEGGLTGAGPRFRAN